MNCGFLSRVAILAWVLIVAVSPVAQPALPTAPPGRPDSGLGARLDAVERSREIEKAVAAQHAETEKAQIDALNKRIDDIGGREAVVNVWLTAVMGFVTIAGFAIGFLAYWAADQRARKSTEQWIKENTSDLNAKLEKMREDVAKLSGDVLAHIEGLQRSTEARAEAAKVRIDEATADATRRIQEGINRGTSVVISASDRERLESAEQALKRLPEAEYSASEWADRAFAAYLNKNYALAAEYFGSAAGAPGATAAQSARFSFNRAYMLGELKSPEDEIAAYDEVIARYKDATELELRVQVAKAMFNRAFTLGELEKSEEAIAAYDEVIARYKDAAELELRLQVGRAKVNRAYRLGKVGRSDDALAANESIIAQYEGESALREHAAMASVNRANNLEELGRIDGALTAYADVVSRFESFSEPEIQAVVATAIVDRGSMLGRLGRAGELGAYQDVITRFGLADEPDIVEQVVEALLNLGARLEKNGDDAGAVAAYDDAIVRSEGAKGRKFRELAARAIAARSAAMKRLGRDPDPPGG